MRVAFLILLMIIFMLFLIILETSEKLWLGTLSLCKDLEANLENHMIG